MSQWKKQTKWVIQTTCYGKNVTGPSVRWRKILIDALWQSSLLRRNWGLWKQKSHVKKMILGILWKRSLLQRNQGMMPCNQMDKNQNHWEVKGDLPVTKLRGTLILSSLLWRSERDEDPTMIICFSTRTHNLLNKRPQQRSLGFERMMTVKIRQIKMKFLEAPRSFRAMKSLAVPDHQGLRGNAMTARKQQINIANVLTGKSLVTSAGKLFASRAFHPSMPWVVMYWQMKIQMAFL